MALINATLSPETLAYVVGNTASKKMREVLEKHYSSSSCTNVVNLKFNLQSIVKKFDESIDAYVKRIKEIKDKFVNVSIIIYTLKGLPANSNTFHNIYNI